MNIANSAAPITIWNFATRQLTSLGTALNALQFNDNATLTNGTFVEFVCGAGQLQLSTVVGFAAANVTWNFGVTAGVTFRLGVAGVAAAAGMQTMCGVNGLAGALQNGGSVAGNYSYSAIRWQ